MFSSSFLPAPVKAQFCKKKNTYKLAKYFDSFFNQFGTWNTQVIFWMMLKGALLLHFEGLSKWEERGQWA